MSRLVEQPYLKKTTPKFSVGDTVSVAVRIEEGGKQRVQAFQGVVIARKGGGINERVWVRKVTQGIGIERMFLLHSPSVEKIKVVRRGDVRRAKLYYIREKVGKAARVKEKRQATTG